MRVIHNWYPYIDNNKGLVHILTTEKECLEFEKSHENAVRLKWNEKYKNEYFLSDAYQEAIRNRTEKLEKNGMSHPLVSIYWTIEETIHPRFPIYYCWEGFSKTAYYFAELTDE